VSTPDELLELWLFFVLFVLPEFKLFLLQFLIAEPRLMLLSTLSDSHLLADKELLFGEALLNLFEGLFDGSVGAGYR
jgi:hypothetical protein